MSSSSRTVLVTGGTGALGGAVTRRLLDDGHRVAATFVVKESVEANPSSIAATIEDVESRFGPVEVLVHLVGGWQGGKPVHETSLDSWDRMIDLNLRSAFLCCRAVLPSMRERGWGRIVLVSSRTARRVPSGQAANAVAKAGVTVLAEAIAEENRGLDVTANVIAPSTLDTAANRASMPASNFETWVPLEDAAANIAFLASDEAGQLRGAWLSLYGSA
jgi:NAD(P)-dependent dehydrogenase (short-subunit alcohol dehydrogenase family)